MLGIRTYRVDVVSVEDWPDSDSTSVPYVCGQDGRSSTLAMVNLTTIVLF